MEHQLELNLKTSNGAPCSFEDSAYAIAAEIIGAQETKGLVYNAMHQHSVFQNSSDQACRIEVRRACKYIQAHHSYWFKGHHWRFPMM